MTLSTTDLLLIINTILTALNPILGSFAWFLKNIRRCRFCNSEISLRSSAINRKNSDETEKKIKKVELV